MAYEQAVWDNRQRVVAMQATAHACAAAAVADVLADLTGVETGVGYGQIQDVLRRALGGLTRRGTTLIDIARTAVLVLDRQCHLFPRHREHVVVNPPEQHHWEVALGLVSPVRGVIVALASPTVTGEGHAVRLLGSSRPLRDPGEDPFIAALTHPRAFTDEFMKVQYFDPDPGRPPCLYGHSFVEPHHNVRARFEAAGGWVLVIERKT